MELRKGQVRSTYVVDSLALPKQTEKRLEALGMTQGTPICILNKKRIGTMIVEVRGARFALGYGITKNIQVKEMEEQAENGGHNE